MWIINHKLFSRIYQALLNCNNCLTFKNVKQKYLNLLLLNLYQIYTFHVFIILIKINSYKTYLNKTHCTQKTNG